MNNLMEKQTLKQVNVPVDMNTAAITGARIGLQKADRCAFVLTMGDSTAALVQFTLNQHTAASAGSSKVLSVMNPYYHKAAPATVFTKVQPTVAASAYDLSSIFSDAEGIAVLEVRGEDLDVANGYGYVSIDAADSTASKILGALYMLSDMRFDPAYSEIV